MTALIRPSMPADLSSVTAIYAQHVLHSTATFETEAPDAQEMAKRREDVLAKGLPYLVLEDAGQVLGFAYGNWFKPRPAYRYSVENSIYLDHQAVGKGYGQALLHTLLQELEARDIRRVLAVIGGDNAASIALHKACGFDHAGVVPDMGWKFERWIDVVFMQRSLGVGGKAPPKA